MCDVVFITPNVTGQEREESLGTLQLATILKHQGVSCDILQVFQFGDLHDFSAMLENAMQMIEERAPKIVSLYCRCDTYHIMLRLAEKVKERYPQIYIVLGGPQADIVSEKTLSCIPWVDYVCCGEGETTIYPFFSSLLNGKPDISVPGLVYRNEEGIQKNPRPKLIEDLDALPMYDYSMFHFGDTNEISNIDVGRGCPFNCTFCSTSSFWGRKYRLKSPQRIYQEVKYLHDYHGKTKFNFSHDMFTLNRKSVTETCELLTTISPKVLWSCSARLDCLNEELIDIMADAGLRAIYIGIETGSPRMQKLIKKNLNLDRMMLIAEHLKKRGLRATASFIYGFPEETEEDICQTMSAIRQLLQLGNITIQTHLCAFQAGTELTRMYASEFVPVDIVPDCTGDFAIHECEDLIQRYPQLFQHFMEYQTELRSKLRYFHIFFYIWGMMKSVYNYISCKYSADHLIDMYSDFVEANRKILTDVSDPYQDKTMNRIMSQDSFPDRFADDENYERIKDICRFYCIDSSDAVQGDSEITEIFGFNPDELKKKPLQDLQRGVAVVNWKNKKRRVQFCPDSE